MTKLTKDNSPQYLTVKECQDICRFRGPDAIRNAIKTGELQANRVSHNRLLIVSESFWKWFHRNDVVVQKVRPVEMPDGAIKKPKKAVAA